MPNKCKEKMLEDARALYCSIIKDLKNEKDPEIKKVIELELDCIREEIEKIQKALNE